MAHNDLLIELTTLGEEISTCLANDKRRNKLSRNAAYRAKKIREATDLWDKFNHKLTEILKVVDQDEPCVKDLKEKYQRIYKEYTDRLLAIPTGSSNSSETKDDDFDEEFNEDDSEFLLKLQSKRLVNLSFVMEDVIQKINNEEVPSASYSEVKKQKILMLWNRVECDDERIFEGVNGYDNYQRELNKIERLVEKSLIFLQDHLFSRSSINASDELKLERLKIDKFGGDYFKWITFKDIFGSFVVNSKKMGKVEKMQRLKTYITGEVADMISDLTISETNFDCSWDRLMVRYDNERLIVGTMINKIINQPNCKGDAKTLQKLLDVTDQMVLALTNLNRPTEHWDDWIVIIIGQKLDEATQKDWERTMGKSTMVPTWPELKEFLTEQWRLMERLEGSTQRSGKDRHHQKSFKSFQTSVEHACVVCGESHTLYNCPKWKNMYPKERFGIVKKNKWCKKCLRTHEDKSLCDKVCKKCNKGHSTWLHENRAEQKQLTVAHGAFAQNPYEILLATAVVKAYDNNGTPRFLRVLIDSGSEGSLITQSAASLLSKRTMKSDRWIQGLDGNKSVPLRKIHLTIQPRFESTFSLQLDFYILNSLTKMLPGHNLDPSSWKHIQLLRWADPKFFEKGRIDALLGMDAIVDIMNSGVVKGKKGQPMAQDTQLGWVISGKIDPTYPTNEFKCFASTSELNTDLRQFWEMEELYPERALTNDEMECEKLYETTVRKNPNGKFIVNIPFKQSPLGPERLGESRGQAIARFLQVEKKLARDQFLNAEYKKAIQSYIEMGHMKDVTGRPAEEKVYYIPHHAVVKPHHLTTKVRVVFDASAKTTTGWSLNDCMHVGAKQQRDLHDILTNWRLFKIGYKADIEKMYRMIELAEEDHKYHTIIWRNSPTELIREYQITATTFGTAAAPFMATRTLVQIAKERQQTHPLAAEALTKNFYVDDLLGGSHSIEEAGKCKDELLTVLGEHHLPLRKWTSNCQPFLDTLPNDLTEKSLKQTIIEDDISKALGLLWSPSTDAFSYKINWLKSEQNTWTKRQFLSETSKLFDPLGWLAPATINAKLLMQEVYILTESGLGWDDLIPEPVAVKWMQFRKEFKDLEQIQINRWIQYEKHSEISLHGFSDASERAYSAAIYARVETNGQTTTTIIAAKTRVAPVKSKLTLPQLELCGALLVAHLMRTIVKSVNFEDKSAFLWTDSMITLGWIRSEPNRWKTFVANRVAKIQSNTQYKWDYVPTSDNPADCASRGIMPLELVNHPLWWTGPAWLAKSTKHWPTADIQDHDLEQKRSFSVNVAQIQQSDLPATTSSWFKLRRIAAYCKRFKTKQKGPLTVDEIRMSEKGLIKKCQQENFYQEIKDLSIKNPIGNKSKLKSLNVFLDQDGILRVGGRLENANIPYGMKHPIILPAGDHLTKIIIHQMHLDTHHGGPKLVKNLIKKKFWIIQGNRMVRTECSQCVVCRKLKGEQYKQQMGDLPDVRVTLNRPFGFSGVDYAGPIEIKSSNLRSAKIQKGYIALFICMGTKAVHLEMVSDQTTKAFLAAFERFTARRGLPNEMYSDNGSNFEGADNQLQRLYFLEQNEKIAKVIVNNEVKWNFIPPGAPNFGGLWERSIRSMKDHMKRTLKTTRLTFEEYSTLLCQIKACLNSRPLCSVSDDVENLEVLTPGHFLIGHELLAPPQPNVGLKLTDNRDRWKQVQWLQHQLWTKWNNEYLVELQQRHKWKEAAENAKAGDIVAVKDEDLAPRNWLVGKIEEVHKGNDNKVRVATIRVPATRGSDNVNTKTPTTTLKSKLIQRPIRKLCPLLVDEDKQKVIDHHIKQQQPTKTYNLRPRIAHVVTMALIFFGLVLGTAAATVNECIQTNKFTNNAGIYFEDIGRASMTKSEWKIQIYFNLDKYNSDLVMIENTITKWYEVCKASEKVIGNSSGFQCTHTIKLLEQQLDDILQMNVIMQQNKQIGNSHGNRTERAAPFNFVGWIGHKLFGIMDATYAEKMEKRIDNINNGLQDVNQLIAEHVSIIDLTKNIIKESHTESQHMFTALTQAIVHLSNETDLYRKKDQIIGWALYTSMVLNNIEKTQRNMVDMLTDLQQGHVSSYLFTPKQFKQELDKINDLIPNGYKLPVNPQKGIKSFYEIMRGQMRVTEDNILLEVIIPLISIEEFQIFHLIPVPVPHNNEKICIIPESQYLSINLKRNLFYQMNENELNNCIKTQEIPLICPAVQSAESITSSKSRCERELLAGSNQIQHCQINVVSSDEVWIPLKSNNNWIFGLENATTLNVLRESNVDTIILQGNGIITIQPGCEISHLGSTIIGRSQVVTSAVHTFIPSMNLSEMIEEPHPSANIINLTMSNAKRFNDINHIVNKMNKTVKSQHHLHWSLHITLFIFVLSLGLTLTILKYKSQIAQWWPRHNEISSQHGRVPIKTEQISNSDDIKLTSIKVEQMPDSVDRNDVREIADSRHGPGGCPFRT